MVTIVDKERFIGLRNLDNWLSKQPWDKQLELPVIMEVRELITKIQERGYYTEEEKNILNDIRKSWLETKNK